MAAVSDQSARKVGTPITGSWGRHHIACGLTRTLSVLLGVLLMAGCAVPRVAAPPRAETDDATVLGIPNARFWADRDTKSLIAEFKLSAAREAATIPPSADGKRARVSFLALSGGGDNGAFGAGLLVGWSANGTRPNFRLVTGVSTGSLIAPFAFLGPAYDARLKAVFTTVTKRNIFEGRGLLRAILLDDALSDTSPLYDLIKRYADEQMLQDIAREYEKGRLLFIGTTNLDVERPVIWNIGAIAASGRPDALNLFHRILLASAAIPGAFPPVMIDVQLNGHPYQEMHVDGGAIAQAFLYPPWLRLQREARALGIERERTVYVIRNGRLDPDWASTTRQFLSITSRSIATMIHYSGVNDVFRIYATARRDGLNFRLAYIGIDFPDTPHPQFDTAYMRLLFAHAYGLALHGYPWKIAPPGLAPIQGDNPVDAAAATSATPSPEAAAGVHKTPRVVATARLWRSGSRLTKTASATPERHP